ncbi:hypothetical protein [Bifidobacterium longum]|jgi:hypothetical protein|uniref:hypothetical protein n=1 Tax=Bifidobacterium longum TaxID=216816 RepID=UPI0015810402|nr:hypothetical protein [Bifidobacterium longum]MDW3110271.1 hypothetical protein [Bifidobacterium longum]
MKFVQLRELLLQRCHTGVGGAQFAGDFAELAIAHHGDGRVVIDIVQRFECLGASAFHHHGDGHGQGDGEENAHAFENVGVAAGHGAGDVLTPRVMAAAIISMMSIGSAGVCPLAVVICSSRLVDTTH